MQLMESGADPDVRFRHRQQCPATHAGRQERQAAKNGWTGGEPALRVGYRGA